MMALVSVSLAAQAQFREGDNVLGIGVGLGGGYGIGFSGSGVSQTPALGVHLDHAMGSLGPGVWGLGGAIGYKGLAYKHWSPGNAFPYNYRYNYLTLGVRGTWHYNEWHGLQQLDTYAGLMLAYRYASFRNRTSYPSHWIGDRYSWSGSGLNLSLLLGARYYFTPEVGAFIEAGFGYAVLQAGIAIKL